MSCGNNGDTSIKCTSCGESIAVDAKFCSHCGETVLDSSEGDNNDNKNDDEQCLHNWKPATCNEPKVCYECSETSGSALGHTTSTGICSRCNVRQGWTKDEVQSLIKVYSVFVDEINSAGGVDMKIAWENASLKTIKYVYFTVEAYNAVDDKVYCEIGDHNEFTGYSTGPFESGYTNLIYDEWEDKYSVDTYWENCYYNSDIRYFLLTNIRIVYMDNTEDNMDSNYVDYAFTNIPQGLVYTWNDEYNGYEVNYRLKSNCSSTEIVIPETYNNEKVVAIADKAFHEISTLQKVTLPSTIKSIGQRAFYECTNLKNINLPNGVKTIGSYAFSGCANLKNISLPNSLSSIETGLFSNCTNLSSLVVPNGVTAIDLHAFFGCENLVTVTIPNTVTSIGDMAFAQCTNLESIVIPISVKEMGYDVFSSSPNLVVYCEASSRPSGWNLSWYYRISEVVWGY